MGTFHLKIAVTAKEFDQARVLFEQYAKSLHFDLAYQDFNKELGSLSQQYFAPNGALMLAFVDNDSPIGCAGVRALAGDIAELKRLYVNPAYRGLNAGRGLLEFSIEVAASLGYKFLRLDTVPGQEKAQRLYRQLGFYEIPPYRHSPIKDTLFLERALN